MITEAHAQIFQSIRRVPEITIIEGSNENFDPIILNSLAEDPTASHEKALLKIYVRLRPGNPANIEKAKQLFHEKFRDPSRYRLGSGGAVPSQPQVRAAGPRGRDDAPPRGLLQRA